MMNKEVDKLVIYENIIVALNHSPVKVGDFELPSQDLHAFKMFMKELARKTASYLADEYNPYKERR